MRSFLEGAWGNLLYKEGSPNLTSLNAHRYDTTAYVQNSPLTYYHAWSR